MLDLQDYSDIIVNFQSSMNSFSTTLFGLTIGLCGIIVLISICITINAVNLMLARIAAVNKLKHDLFYKEDCFTLLYNKHVKDERINELVEKSMINELTEREKFEIAEKDLFYEQLIILNCETKKKLKYFLKHVDNGN